MNLKKNKVEEDENIEPISDEELKKLHDQLLKMAKVIRKIIEEENLQYFILGGTLLGAIRHKGFIPWDDDFDIGLPRKDYEKLVKVIASKLPEGYDVLHYSRKDNIKREDRRFVTRSWTKVIDLNSYMHSMTSKGKVKRNIFIDVFPLDGIPDSFIKRYKYKINARKQWLLLRLAKAYNGEYTYVGANYLKMMIFNFLKLLKIGSKLNIINQIIKFDKAITEKECDNSHYICNVLGGYGLFVETFKRKDFGKGIEYKFEDTTFKGPENADAVLRQMYGKKYNEIPPVGSELRQCKHSFKIEIN